MIPICLHACGAEGTFDALSLARELQAVVGAANPVLLVAAEVKRSASVRAELVDQADLALGVAECKQLLAEDLYPHLRAVRFGNFA